MTTMRVASPCSENLDAMPRDAEGNAHCTRCERSVVDLRGARRKRALAVIDGLRKQGDGTVCVRVNATRDGTPVFASDPSPLARFVAPVALAGSLAACAPQASSPVTAPVSIVATPSSGSNSNTTATRSAPVVTTPVRSPVQNVNQPTPEITAVAGGLAFAD